MQFYPMTIEELRQRSLPTQLGVGDVVGCYVKNFTKDGARLRAYPGIITKESGGGKYEVEGDSQEKGPWVAVDVDWQHLYKLV